MELFLEALLKGAKGFEKEVGIREVDRKKSLFQGGQLFS
jgi:hypothetical protein